MWATTLATSIEAIIFGLGAYCPVWPTLKKKKSIFPHAWHIAELKPIMKFDRAIKKMDGPCPPWVWLTIEAIASQTKTLALGSPR